MCIRDRALPVSDGRRFARDDLANYARIVSATRGELLDERFSVVVSRDNDETDPHVERAQHVVVGNAAPALQPREDRRYLPGGAVDHGRGPVRKDTWKIVRNPSAGDVRH